MGALLKPSSSTARNDVLATETIAKETATSVEVVKEIYEQEITALATDAKITQYLGVLASRRVRMLLRKH